MKAIVIGASGGIGGAFVKSLCDSDKYDRIYAFSYKGEIQNHDKVIKGELDLTNEASIEAAAQTIKEPCHLIIVATGILHTENFKPEKSIRELNLSDIEDVMRINYVGPSLIGKYFIKHIARDEKSVFAFLSARVGSISDNQLGGWYSYRASKAALNMFIKTASIEAARKYKNLAMIGLHPGTVETNLSAPFSMNIPEGKLFDPEFAVKSMLKVIDEIKPEQTGRVFAYDGQEIAP
jgi:NAD(P)-dependent dehydrogenase (short-subunit alcohol dehydrogenase family)